MASHAQAGQVPAASGVGSDEQRRVDAILAEARSDERRPLFKPAPPPPPPLAFSSDAVDHRLSEELEYARRVLESMGDQLSCDPVILQRHMRAMQGFDLVGQILGHLAKVIATENKRAAIDLIGMHELRARLKRQPL